MQSQILLALDKYLDILPIQAIVDFMLAEFTFGDGQQYKAYIT